MLRQLKMSKSNFNYEKKKWGTGEVDLTPEFLGATRLKYALKSLEAVSKGEILEVGCGGGAFSRAIKRYRPELKIIGCDLSREVLLEAKKKNQGISYQQADVYHLPFKEKRFRAVVSFDVWEHLEKPKLALREVYRVLQPGGVLHFFVPLEGGQSSLYKLLFRNIYRIKREYTGHIQAYTKNELIQLFKENGFCDIKYTNSCFLIYRIVDLSYFIFLKIRGKNTAVSVEGYLEFAKRSLFDKLLKSAKELFGLVTYLENEIFRKFPGGGIHITAVKK